MLRTTTQRLTGLVLLAMVTVSVSADAGDDEVRIGRYATVVDRSPLTEKDTTSRPGSMVLPSEISSRTDAVQWILEQHGYRLYENTCDAFDLASGLAAPLSIHLRRISISSAVNDFPVSAGGIRMSSSSS